MTGETIVCRFVLAVALDAETHFEVAGLDHTVHGRDVAMASAAVEASLDVHGVVEVDELGKPVHPLPDDRLVLREMLPQFDDVGIGPDDAGVTQKAGFQRRNAGTR